MTTSRHHNMMLLRALQEKIKRESAKDLHTFLKHYAWPVSQPGVGFVDNWHIGAICEHLEAVTRRDIKRLLINVPFRTAKSTITSVAWPAWTWITKPNHQWLCGSYAEKLAIRDSLRHRRLVTSSLYQNAWGDKVQLAPDQNEKMRFQNTANGTRIAFGMTGGVMGDGGDTILIDDPHDRQGAHSDAERESALTTYDEALITRLNDPANGAIVIIMQRLHQNDLSGHVLKEKGWEHLLLPMEYEPQRAKVTSLGFRDPRTVPGQLLDPVRFPSATLDALKTSLGDYGTAGQLQQRPSPAGGGILKPDKFRLWPAHKQIPQLQFVLQSYDTAFTERTNNDPSANTTWGVFEFEGRRNLLLLECWADHLTYPVARKRLMDDWHNARYGGDPKDPLNKAVRADVVLIEEKGSGISLIQELRLANLPIKGYNPGKADKTARAHMASPFLDQDIVWVLESKRDKGKPVRWARPFLEQCEQFPNGEHDDMVDTFTQSMIYLRDANQLELPAVPDEQPEEVDYVARRKARHPENVYSL